jgi:transcriptional regulator with XRE-family HTH domain
VIDNTSSYLALNVREYRNSRQLSQAQLAKLAGIPRPTLAHLESGSANPTLSVMMRLASALQVLIEELVAPPRATVRHFTSEELPKRQRGSVSIRKLLPDPIRGLDIERLEIPAGALLSGIPHARGTRKFVICENGAVFVTVNEEKNRLERGDLLSFRGDQGHTYLNSAQELAIVYSVVTTAPIPE